MTKIAHIKPEHEQDSAVAERNDEKVTRVARATSKAGADVARERVQVAQSTADAAEDLYETARQLAKESPEFGRAFTDLTRQSVDTFSALARAVNWTDVAQAQSELIAGSLRRITQFNARYGALVLRGMTATATSPRR
jgi:ABC-type nitrate/sulfonate/bicarbonate transport system substrate-binding protein